MEKIKEEMESLIKEIEEHNHRYYVLDSPIISDKKYDLLLKKLEMLEREYPELAIKNSPTKRVGGIVAKGFKQIKHEYKMLSLSNTYNSSDILEFDTRVRKFSGNIDKLEYVLEEKFDGISVSLKYIDGKLIYGATRGDGIVGEDITNNIVTINSVPLILKKKVTITVRGEVYIDKSDFVKLNLEREERGETVFANPRNFASGSLRQLDSSVTAKRPLKIFIYDIMGDLDFINVENEKIFLENHIETLEFLRKIGFRINNNYKLFDKIDELINYCLTSREYIKNLPYDVDGLVIKVNDYNIRKKIGYTSKYPRWATSYKFPQELKKTKLVDIEINVGKSGILTPVAIMEPVNIGGSVVRRASLHNWDEIEEKDIRIGDNVLIQKAGEIIPQVVEVVKEDRTEEIPPVERPQKCPSCGGEVSQIPGEVAIRCENINCIAQLIRRVEFFVSKDGIDIDGLGPKIVEQLINEGLIKDISDIFYLTKEQLLNLDRMGELLAAKIINSINMRRNLELDKFICGLNISYVGKSTSQTIATFFKDFSSLINAPLETLENIGDIGEKTALSIYKFFHNEKNMRIINRLFEANVRIVESEYKKIEKIAGFKFVITGTLKKPRNLIKDMIKKSGGIVSDSISKKTDYLIAGEKAGSKLEKARKLGIKILSEEEFDEMMKY